VERSYFSEEEINELRNNKFVKTVSSKSVSYTDEFKILFIDELKKGKGPTRIFIENGFNPYILGPYRINSFAKLIKRKNKNNELFVDNRGKKATGRPKEIKETTLSKDEEIESLKHENLLLKAENDLLKKMEFLANQKLQKKLQQEKDTK